MTTGSDGTGSSVQGLDLRIACVSALEMCLEEQFPLDSAIERALAAGSLSQEAREQGRPFVRQAVAITLRRLGQIDDVLNHFISKPLPNKARRVMSVLRVAAAQLLFMDVADHAALHVAVEQVKLNRRVRHMSGLVNAVLRKVAGEGRALIAQHDEVVLNTPKPLLAIWQADYGDAVARDIALAHATTAALDLTAKDDTDELAKRVGGVVLRTGSVRLPGGGRVDTLPGYDNGTWWVQDASAALPARLFDDVKGKRICDLCAAPGGKTAQLAAAGADVLAVDRSKQRTQKLRANLKRLGLQAEIQIGDALQDIDGVGLDDFDSVLLDAPCSSTGTIRRHPELVWRFDPHASAYAELLALQQNMLRRAAGLVKRGGALVYCTCSLQKAEGEAQVAAFLADHPDWSTAHIGGRAQQLGLDGGWITDEGWLRLLPHYDPRIEPRDDVPVGMDGFFAAHLVRSA